MGKLTHTVKGPIASFRSADKAPIESLKLHFLPKQEGSGNPSPTNIRPITGWTGCNLYKCKSLWDGRVERGILGNSGGEVSSNSNLRNVGYIAVQPNKVIRIKYTQTSPSMSNIRIFRYASDFSYISDMWVVPGTVTLSATTYYIRFYMDTGFTTQYQNNKNKLAIDYNANLETTAISWLDHGIEYGGYVDPVKGKMFATHKRLVLTGYEDITYSVYNGSIYTSYNNTIRVLSDSKAGDSIYGWCNMVSSDSSHELRRAYIRKAYDGYGLQFYYTTTFWGLEEATAEAWVEKLKEWSDAGTPFELIYELATPIEYDLASQEMQAFLDYNNFWSDLNDDTEVEYEFADRLAVRKTILDTPHIASVSGSIASFETDMKAPIVDLKARFLPIQAGSGDPSPSNVRPISGWTGINLNADGRNIMDLQNATWVGNTNKVDKSVSGDNVTVTAKTSGRVGFEGSQYSIKQAVPPAWCGKDIYFGCSEVIHNNTDHICSVVIEFRDASNVFITDPTVIYTGTNMLYRKITIPSNAAKMEIMFRIAQNCGSVDVNIGDYVTFVNFYTRFPAITYGYDAFCGRNIPIEFPATKNLFDVNNGMFSASSYSISGDIITQTGSDGRGWTSNQMASMHLSAGTYAFSCSDGNVLNVATSIDGYATVTRLANGGGVITLAQNCDVKIKHTASSYPTSFTIQIEHGSAITAYEPYGTVYGGYVDLIRGKLVAEWKKLKVKDLSFWSYNSDYGRFASGRFNGQSRQGRKLICDSYAVKSATGTEGSYSGDLLSYIYGSVSYFQIHVKDSRYNGDTNAFISGSSDVEFVINLDTPIEYDLTPQQLKTLLGQNNIWSDTNGNVEVKYWTH